MQGRKLDLNIRKIDVISRKIDNNKLKSRIIIALFQIDEKDRKSSFFELIFLLTNISINIALKMFFSVGAT